MIKILFVNELRQRDKTVSFTVWYTDGINKWNLAYDNDRFLPRGILEFMKNAKKSRLSGIDAEQKHNIIEYLYK